MACTDRSADERRRFAPTVKGPALLPAPSCAETWICRCSSAWLPEGLPLLDPGAPAQVPLPDHGVPEGTSLAVRSTIRRSLCFRPASRPSEDVSRPGVRRSFLGRPPIPRLDLLGRSALATAGTNSSGASDRLVRKSSLAVRGVIARKEQFSLVPEGLPSPAGGDRSFRPLLPPCCRCRLPWKRRGLPSRSQLEPDSRFRVAQSGICSAKPVDNGDIGDKSRIARRESPIMGEWGAPIGATAAMARQIARASRPPIR